MTTVEVAQGSRDTCFRERLANGTLDLASLTGGGCINFETSRQREVGSNLPFSVLPSRFE